MSDDTPTERFDASASGSPENTGSGDAPTQRLTTAASPAASGQPNNRRLIVILAIIGALLLLAVLIVLLLLLTRGSGTPTALPTETTSATATSKPTPTTSATPTSTPKPTPTPTPTVTVTPPPPPPPPSTAPSIDSFTISPTTVYCNTHSPGGPFNQYLAMKWTTTNASTVTIGSYDPYGDYAGQYYNLPNDGDTTTQGLQITYNCPEASQVWRLEVKGQDGSTIKKEIKILNMGDQS